MNAKFLNLDNETKTGAFTVHSKQDIDMAGIRKYCAQMKKGYGELTKKEIASFVKK